MKLRPLVFAATLAMAPLLGAMSASADGETERLIEAARADKQWSVVALLYGQLIDEGAATGEDLAALYQQRAQAYYALESLHDAFADCENAIEAAPRAPIGYSCRGEIALAMGDVDGALADLDHALAVDPGSAEAYHLRGAALMQLGAYDEALVDFNKAVDLGNRTAPVLADRCACHYNMGHFAFAEDDCRAAIAADGDYGWAHNNMALLLWRDNDLDGALEALNTAIALMPNEAVPRRNRAGVYFERGAYDKAIEDQDRLIAANPDDGLTLDNRGMAHAGNGDFDLAIEDHRASLDLMPNDAYALANLGYALIATGSLTEGEAAMEAAIKATGGDPWVHGLLGHAYLLAGEYADAVGAFQRGWDQQGDTALLGGLALGLAELGDRNGVDRIAQRIRNENPYHQVARQHLARAYFVLGDADEALRHINAALAVAPGVAETHHLAGIILTELGRTDAALADFDQSMAIGGTSRIRMYHRRLAALGYDVDPAGNARDAAFEQAFRDCVENRCDLDLEPNRPR